MRARDRAALRHGRRRHLRPVGSDRARGRLRVRRDQGRAAHLGGPFLSRDHRPRDRRRAAGRRDRRTGLHLPDQGGDADHPLPHARPDAAPAGDRAVDAPDGEDHGPHRRHDHPARRQCLSDPGRGADFEMRRARPAFPHRAFPPREDGRDDGGGRGASARRRRGAARIGARKSSPITSSRSSG